MMRTCGANRWLTIKTKKNMKRYLFIVAAVVFFAFTACNKDEFQNNFGEYAGTIEFEAGFDRNTKTTLGSNNKTLWIETDLISINGVKFKIKKLHDSGASATFVNAEDVPENFGAPYNAIYPYGATSISAEQTAYAGNFDPSAVLEIAKSDTKELKFENATSLLKFQVTKACETLTITSSDYIAGESTTLTLNGPFQPGQDYYAAVEPGMKQNFTLSFNGIEVKTAPSVEVLRSYIHNMGTLQTHTRLYVTSEKTGFTMKIYAWDSESGAQYTSDYPGDQLFWDTTTNKYYYDFPLELSKKEIKFVVNVNGDNCKTKDESKIFNNLDETYDLNWKWLYLKPNSNWKQSNAKFAAYFFTKDVSGEYWQWMMMLDANHYGCVIPEGTKYKNVIFCRMKNDASHMNWDNKWNQTGDLTIPTNGHNLFTLSSSTWDGATTTWSKKTF